MYQETQVRKTERYIIQNYWTCRTVSQKELMKTFVYAEALSVLCLDVAVSYSYQQLGGSITQGRLGDGRMIQDDYSVTDLTLFFIEII